MNSRLALITFLDGGGGNYPDNTLPGIPSGPVDPAWGVTPPVDPGWGVTPPVDPGYGRPTLPPHVGGGPARPPVYPAHPLPKPPDVTIDNTLPTPPSDNVISLPIYLPPTVNPPQPIRPDQKFELKFSIRFGWVLVPVEDETAQPK